MPEDAGASSGQPYLSIVGWGRNDGYSPNYIERLRHALSTLLRQLHAHRLPAEIVIADWNPPPDRPALAEVLAPLPAQDWTTVRVLTVGAAFHHRYRGWIDRGINTVDGANVGLRRARGRFVTPKALDTYFSDELVARLARQDLDADCVYRCDRHDLTIEGDAWMTGSDADVFRAFAAAPTNVNARITQSDLWRIHDLHTNACGDFTLLSNERWHGIRGYPKDRTVLGLDADSIALHAAAAHGAREVCFPADCRIFKISHGNVHAERVRQVWQPWQRWLERYLLKKDRRDLTHTARILFNYPKRRVRGVDRVLGPSIERNFVARAERFARGDTSRPINEPNWGLGKTQLPERIVARAAWDLV